MARDLGGIGHIDLLENGFDYHFDNGPDYLEDNGRGRRATFRKYQTYPVGKVEGRAALVNGDGYMGKYWKLFQPAQVVQNHVSIMADLIGGGIDAGQITMQPLLDTSS